MYKPNLFLPLASSYNERGAQGYTTTITNSIDQRKINCFYEITKNSVTGQGKLDLVKRPAPTANAGTCALSTQSAYAICTDFISETVADSIVFATQGALTIESATVSEIKSVQ